MNVEFCKLPHLSPSFVVPFGVFEFDGIIFLKAKMSDVESPRSSRSGRRRPTALSRLAARKKHEDSDDGSEPMSKISTPRLVLKKYLGCDKSN